MTDIEFGKAEFTKDEFDRIAPGYLNKFADASQHRWRLSELPDCRDKEDNHPFKALYDCAGQWYRYGFVSTADMNVKAYSKIMAEHRTAAKAMLAEVE